MGLEHDGLERRLGGQLREPASNIRPPSAGVVGTNTCSKRTCSADRDRRGQHQPRHLTNATVCWAGRPRAPATAKFGWYLNLPGTQEQIIFSPELVRRRSRSTRSCRRQHPDLVHEPERHRLHLRPLGADRCRFQPGVPAARVRREPTVNTNRRYTDSTRSPCRPTRPAARSSPVTASGTKYLVYETNQVQGGNGAAATTSRAARWVSTCPRTHSGSASAGSSCARAHRPRGIMQSTLHESATQRGFTLIELMVVVVIATILVGIAVPSYMSQMRKSRRTDAKTALLELAGREERFLSHQWLRTTPARRPTWGTPAAGPEPDRQRLLPDSGLRGHANGAGMRRARLPGPPSLSPRCRWPVTSQAQDAACTSFTVDSTGRQTAPRAGRRRPLLAAVG